MDPRGFMNRRSRVISRAAEMLSREFGIDNPKISLIEIRNPWLEPRIVARKAAKDLEMGKKARSIMYRLLGNIMQNGAVGAEIVALGKIGAKGAKSKKIKVYAGFVPKAGNPVKDVRTVHYATVTKSGIIGITVRIAPPDIYLPDKMDRIKKDIAVEEGPATAAEEKKVVSDAVAKA